MKRACSLVSLRICMAVLALLMAVWAQGAAPVASASGVVICADGMMKTVWLDAQGKTLPAPPDCDHCALCALSVAASGARGPGPVRPVALLSAVVPAPAVRLVPARWSGGVRPRGPPTQTLVVYA